MKCYIVNLDRAPERMARMSQILQSQSIDFERLPAVDGKLFSDNDIKVYRAQRQQGKPMTVGEIACAESHIAIFRKIVAGVDDYAVVMEDDLHLSDDAGAFINSVDWIPSGAEIVKLETVNEPTIIATKHVGLINDRKLVQLAFKHWGSGAYVISKSAARKALMNYVAGLTPIDDYLFDPTVNDFSLWQMQPAIAVQDIILNNGSAPQSGYLASGIEDGRKVASIAKSKKVGVLTKLKREALRFVRKTRRRTVMFWGIRVSKTIERATINYRP
ncbi:MULTISPECIES: glycosyltransferase family 25 protein [Brucella/Ochrobactrum group]|jgi:glycosyl transferase family 25|uniref:glycosyltransferase family 25 protein n=1 Tax=Brucella/Ochrobactrum group TaxID=2826938 RepID=UPI001C041557|nr:glycosyltransferase family 25 protein [Brucella sp. NBRC 12950]QWK79155.1 glycosyltransferase family 25 protein [Ochrobactrum sp. BTU1]GLU25522.1 glycosyl transferase [Brucella sp. NBRC 12950]